MPKEFGYWNTDTNKQSGCALGQSHVQLDKQLSAPNLMRSVEELEDELTQRVMRNLNPIDVPRGQDYYQEVYRILGLENLPDAYAPSSVWQHAHQLYWQIEAFKGNPEAIAYHPV